MPDIAMCTTGCPRCMECLRFRAVPNPLRQSYTTFDAKGLSSCPSFMSIIPSDDVMPVEYFTTDWDYEELQVKGFIRS